VDSPFLQTYSRSRKKGRRSVLSRSRGESSTSTSIHFLQFTSLSPSSEQVQVHHHSTWSHQKRKPCTCSHTQFTMTLGGPEGLVSQTKDTWKIFQHRGSKTVLFQWLVAPKWRQLSGGIFQTYFYRDLPPGRNLSLGPWWHCHSSWPSFHRWHCTTLASSGSPKVCMPLKTGFAQRNMVEGTLRDTLASTGPQSGLWKHSPALVGMGPRNGHGRTYNQSSPLFSSFQQS
jgi:hypothetical protein